MNRANIKAALADPKKRDKILLNAAKFLQELANEPPHKHYPSDGYTVTYAIDVDAGSAEDAARVVEDILLDPRFRYCLDVRDNNTGKTITIDLEDMPC